MQNDFITPESSETMSLRSQLMSSYFSFAIRMLRCAALASSASSSFPSALDAVNCDA